MSAFQSEQDSAHIPGQPAIRLSTVDSVPRKMGEFLSASVHVRSTVHQLKDFVVNSDGIYVSVLRLDDAALDAKDRGCSSRSGLEHCSKTLAHGDSLRRWVAQSIAVKSSDSDSDWASRNWSLHRGISNSWRKT